LPAWSGWNFEGKKRTKEEQIKRAGEEERKGGREEGRKRVRGHEKEQHDETRRHDTQE
jgi:hypothetical protein